MDAVLVNIKNETFDTMVCCYSTILKFSCSILKNISYFFQTEIQCFGEGRKVHAYRNKRCPKVHRFDTEVQQMLQHRTSPVQTFSQVP